MAGSLNVGKSQLQKRPIIPLSDDAGKGTPRGEAFVAVAPAPVAVTLDELEEAGAMAVGEAAEELRERQEGKAAGDKSAEDKGVSSEGQALAAPVPEEARTPKTKKPPLGMVAAEWQVHRLTHLPIIQHAGAALPAESGTTNTDERQNQSQWT